MKLRFVLNHFLHEDGVDMNALSKEASSLAECWEQYNDAILAHLAWLGFQEEDVNVYVVKREQGGRSMPLMVSTSGDAFATLVHELIHRILGEREEALAKKLYPDEDPLAGGHILIHAIHEDIYRNIIHDENALAEDIRFCAPLPAYKRAWDVVRKDGYINIIAKIEKALHDLT